MLPPPFLLSSHHSPPVTLEMDASPTRGPRPGSARRRAAGPARSGRPPSPAGLPRASPARCRRGRAPAPPHRPVARRRQLAAAGDVRQQLHTGRPPPRRRGSYTLIHYDGVCCCAFVVLLLTGVFLLWRHLPLLVTPLSTPQVRGFTVRIKFADINEDSGGVEGTGDRKHGSKKKSKSMNLRLQKIDGQIKCINEMCNMMSLDLKKTLYEVHPSFVELERIKAMSISDSTPDRLAGKVHALNQEKKQRLRKLQDLGRTLIELWSLMDTPLDEQKCVDHVTSLISVSPNTVIPQGCLAHDLIEKVEVEVKRLKHLKASKMKELVLKENDRA